MNTQSKLITIFLLTALALGSGVYYFLGKDVKTFSTTTRSQYWAIEKRPITPGVDLSKMSDKNVRKKTFYGNLTPNSAVTSLLSSSQINANEQKYVASTKKQLTLNLQTVARKDERFYSTVPSNMLLMSYDGSVRPHAAKGVEMNAGSTSLLSFNGMITPMSVPQTPVGMVLVDPMPDEDIIKIPVGEGFRFLLLLIVGYALIQRRVRLA